VHIVEKRTSLTAGANAAKMRSFAAIMMVYLSLCDPLGVAIHPLKHIGFVALPVY